MLDAEISVCDYGKRLEEIHLKDSGMAVMCFCISVQWLIIVLFSFTLTSFYLYLTATAVQNCLTHLILWILPENILFSSY